MKPKCSLCGKPVDDDEIYGFYPEDNSVICKNCYGIRKEAEEGAVVG